MTQRTIAEIKQLLQAEEIGSSFLSELKQDARKGVQQAIRSYERREAKRIELQQLYEKKQAFERQYLQVETDLLAGVDEAGRGPLAGPVVAAAVVLPTDFKEYRLTDSKQLTESVRNELYPLILEQAICYHIAVVQANVIDRVNILEATKLAMREALQALQPMPQIGLIDAVPLQGLPFPTESVTKGDDRSIAIAAASVLAKVKRDQLMTELHDQFPVYDFQQNKGYGTKQHMKAMEVYGACEQHRRSFTPVKTALMGT